IRAVTGCMSGLLPPKVLATSRSFHTQRNWKIPNEAIAGIDSGSTIDRKMRRCGAPSTRAASMSDDGSWAMKLWIRKMAAGHLPDPQLHRPAAVVAHGGRPGGRRPAPAHLPVDRAAAVDARDRLVRDLPVPLGVERPASRQALRWDQSRHATRHR